MKHYQIYFEHHVNRQVVRFIVACKAENAGQARLLFYSWHAGHMEHNGRPHAFHVDVMLATNKKLDGIYANVPRMTAIINNDCELDAELVAVANSTLAQAAGYSLDEARKMLGEKFLPPKGWKGGNA